MMEYFSQRFKKKRINKFPPFKKIPKVEFFWIYMFNRSRPQHKNKNAIIQDFYILHYFDILKF